MRIEVLVPQLPESVSDAILVSWHSKAGDSVEKDQSLLDLETDKVVLEVPVPTSGTLLEIRRSQGDVVTSGDLLAVIETSTKQRQMAAMTLRPEPESQPEPNAPAAALEPPVSPAVRRLLTEHQLSPTDIPVEGRISKQDVLNFIERRDHPDMPKGSMEQTPLNLTPPLIPMKRRVPMTRIRARIAERMVEAQKTTATLTTFNEVNLEKVFSLRQQHRARFESVHGVKLGLMSFFVKASVEALKRFPIINASLDGQDIVYHDSYDIGIAVTTERGLVVPVLKNADHLGFAEIEKAINDYSLRGRDGKLHFEELTGGTFTITNGGIFGSMLSTPILNPPQSAILGMHAIKDRPVVEDGQIVIRPMIYLALSYDHRIIDGRDAVSFLFTIKELLEDPSRLLLNL